MKTFEVSTILAQKLLALYVKKGLVIKRNADERDTEYIRKAVTKSLFSSILRYIREIRAPTEELVLFKESRFPSPLREYAAAPFMLSCPEGEKLLAMLESEFIAWALASGIVYRFGPDAPISRLTISNGMLIAGVRPNSPEHSPGYASE